MSNVELLAAELWRRREQQLVEIDLRLRRLREQSPVSLHPAAVMWRRLALGSRLWRARLRLWLRRVTTLPSWWETQEWAHDQYFDRANKK